MFDIVFHIIEPIIIVKFFLVHRFVSVIGGLKK